MRLTDFKVLTFDCYGTLIDWESGMIEALRPLTGKVGRPLTRNEILEAHAFHGSLQQRQTPAQPYRDLLPIVFKRLAEQWGVSVTREQCAAYGRSVGNWPAFADSPGALQYLKQHRHEAGEYRRIELITGLRGGDAGRRRRRRRWWPRACSRGVNISALARRSGVNRGLLQTWRRTAMREARIARRCLCPAADRGRRSAEGQRPCE